MKLANFFGSAPAISAGQAHDLLKAGAVLLDVRESVEWNQGHAPEAIHIPLSRISQAAASIDNDAQVLVLCRSGHRAKLATTRLRSLGYNAVTITGGMPAWTSSGGRITK